MVHTAAIHILSGLLSDGNTTAQRPPRHHLLSGPKARSKPTLIPPPSQIALLATLIVHPAFTSRAPEISNIHAASHALSYLRGLLSTLLFRRAPDFWAVLGWCFRCAAEHPRTRWRHWRVWLDLVVAVLEADLDERLARDRRELDGRSANTDTTITTTASSSSSSSSSPPCYPMLAGSIVVGYVEALTRERRSGGVREVLRALFAFSDGEVNGPSDRAVFREVFERETAAASGAHNKRKRGEDAVVDLENGRRKDGKAGRKPRGAAAAAGGGTPSFTLTEAVAETVPFRLRIFRLLSAVSYYLPGALTPVDELYERFTDHVRALPLPAFRRFVEAHPSVLPEDVQVSVLRAVVEALLPPPRRPRPADADPAASTGVTVPVLLRCFLPFAAARVTAEDNAKLSLALESMAWLVYARVGFDHDEDEDDDPAELRRAVETGIRAREDRIRKNGSAAADGAAREVLARSARNLRTLVDVVAAAAASAASSRR
ncbi:hypothetical protein VTH06DRAFT_8622 [Thermothelomyces fergusii]